MSETRAAFYGALALACWFGANDNDLTDEIASENRAKIAAHDQRVRDVCTVRGYIAVRDTAGVVTCPDDGPSWAIGSPLGHVTIAEQIRDAK